MHALQKIEIVQALMAMFIPNVGALLVIMAVNADETDVFSEIEKPAWMPVVWVTATLWCTFYCVIGFASNMVFKNREVMGMWTVLTKAALIIYGVHLVISWSWSLTFFFKRDMMLAAMVMVLVDVTALHASYLFYKVKSIAGYLFIPYIFWLSFITILNFNMLSINYG